MQQCCQEYFAGLGSVRPKASVARTWKVACRQASGMVTVTGEVQLSHSGLAVIVAPNPPGSWSLIQEEMNLHS